jgi:hypothetical protein
MLRGREEEHFLLRSGKRPMTYTLHQLAVGSYDLALDGIIVGSVIQAVSLEARRVDGALRCSTS